MSGFGGVFRHPIRHLNTLKESSKIPTFIYKCSIDSVDVRVYSPEKTIADAFKFRNKIGLDVAVDALKRWAALPNASPAILLRYARICRVDRVIRPYLEAIL